MGEVVRKLRAMPEAQYEDLLSGFLEEQPYLGGFLLNLDGDFSEPEMDRLYETALALNLGFKTSGLTMGMVLDGHLEGIIQEITPRYEALGETAIDFNAVIAASDSPKSLQDLFAIMEAGLIETAEIQKLNRLMVVEVMVKAFEEGVESPNETQHGEA
jgi:hypothetical protein